MAVPRVVASNEPLGELNGLELVVLEIELWEKRLVVRLACSPNALTRDLDRKHSDEMEAWHRLVTSGIDRAGLREKLPQNPASELLQSLRVALTDDVGTQYEWIGGAGPGWNGRTGIRWLHEQEFIPPPSSDARELRVTVEADENARATLTVDLDTR